MISYAFEILKALNMLFCKKDPIPYNATLSTAVQRAE
jgi:hypothetical protein